MEKIKQALERAKNENVQNRTLGSHSGKSRKPKNGARAEIKEIQYNQTQVVETVTTERLKNRIVVGSGGAPGGAETGYKILRTQVEQRMAANGWNALAVTSPAAGAGKTVTAINLSIALAQEIHRTVLLVDLDLRNPNVHKRFNCTINYGLVDYLLDDIPLSDILLNPGIDRLVILPAGVNSISNSSELIASPKMVDLVDELKSRYPSRLIVFDLPPVLSSDDALAFTPFVDAALVVVAEGLTTNEELKRTLEIMGNSNLLGTILNKSSEEQSTYYG